MPTRTRQLITQIQDGRALADCSPIERAVIFNLRETQRLGRLITDFAEACVDDGGISPRAIDLLRQSTEANRTDAAARADIYGDD
jgi:hypothetical protein